jgi:hypothetical protein
MDDQKLAPELKEIYERVMQTPVKPQAQAAQGPQPIQPTPTTPPMPEAKKELHENQQKQEEQFISSSLQKEEKEQTPQNLSSVFASIPPRPQISQSKTFFFRAGSKPTSPQKEEGAAVPAKKEGGKNILLTIFLILFLILYTLFWLAFFKVINPFALLGL